ncbi:hypothetical protein KIN20_013612 [Parelaphostrongylus tenuis]|uniref:Uncharacterized protein n=1 Tax=Parelaphostrongylus tenuis TaxID=148309 RepID=A0AAD5QR59_PARTN|nr:hypothetical protein KIN20_013612 [Parelaphostrongylus tenuis]
MASAHRRGVSPPAEASFNGEASDHQQNDSSPPAARSGRSPDRGHLKYEGWIEALSYPRRSTLVLIGFEKISFKRSMADKQIS